MRLASGLRHARAQPGALAPIAAATGLRRARARLDKLAPIAAATGLRRARARLATLATITAAAGLLACATEPEPAPPVPEAMVRRLTAFEYANTVRDVLGVEAALTREFPADPPALGFDTVAASQPPRRCWSRSSNTRRSRSRPRVWPPSRPARR
ncbi:DUF1587 domain-containing protein [Nannocystis pusilla]|uniref:DUF1587 domain-containing protein n=1 Tax=Nannocystis pusilla TaxID=889268 RepID=A0A9X3EWF8_9BACT|nr:DUF1587 domain-containing protein [Nannocystis pusilla]MCY1010620.1 DUF1587 domain-containing protein [Nannocystis pusilla]